MEIQIKVPYWVKTEDEGTCILFAFLRRLHIEYDIRDVGMDMYGYDIRRILGVEEKDLHDLINERIDIKYCKIAKLNREHFVFMLKHYRVKYKLVTLKEHESIVKWAYLLGCSNFNLIEDREHLGGFLDRPTYTPMHRLDREMFSPRAKH
tara:strand:+ start:5068 stop:5517 length:450 start_codon:yes stop_codon:yes gene_type:complete